MSEEHAERTPGEKRAAPARSEIAFPYTHLEDALGIAKAIYDSGSPLMREQIAGVLGLPPTSGGFSLKISAAKTFRLIENVDSRYQVTDLGLRALSLDETESRVARRDAFLSVELYQKTLETFRNRVLPPRPSGLENAFVEFGVAPKQKDKARLAFERSALFAGFFHAGRERLVEPIINQSAGSARQMDAPHVMNMPVHRVELGPADEPLISGLLKRLPQIGEPWSLNSRARWLRALAVSLSVVYGEEDEAELTIQAPTVVGAILQKIGSAPGPVTPKTPAAVKPDPKPVTGWDADRGGGDLDDEIPF